VTVNEATTLDADYDTLIEQFYAEGWTDGLPFVLPTTDRVDRMLDANGWDPDEVLGSVPPRGSQATRRLVAVNAVMAGCVDAHLPVVEAALLAALAPEHNLNGVTCTTHMCVPLVIVNGPQRTRLGFNATDGVFGNGSRANGAVGRALRLICWNLGAARPGDQDKSTLSHPGEWTFCIAEDEEGSPWEPLHVERGCPPGSDAVTVFACESPHSIVAIGSPENMLNRIVDHLSSRGSNNSEYRWGAGGQLLVTVNAEQAERFAADTWTKQDVKRYLWEHSTCKVRDRMDVGEEYTSEVGTRDGYLAQGLSWSDWSDPDADLTITPTPDDIHLVVAGGRSYFASVLPGWGPFGGFAATREVVALHTATEPAQSNATQPTQSNATQPTQSNATQPTGSKP
jgi:hypothetical protein